MSYDGSTNHNKENSNRGTPYIIYMIWDSSLNQDIWARSNIITIINNKIW